MTAMERVEKTGRGVMGLLHRNRRALRDPAWASGIAAAGRARTLAHHTVDHRVREMEALWTA